MPMTNAGGRRSNSGRKADPNKRQTFTLRLKPETIGMIQELKKEGYKLGEKVDLWIADLYEQTRNK